ncbi:MAG: NifB/NifX family molybdenum-iron cluster-binding protein [Pirellulaceae bacterium]
MKIAVACDDGVSVSMHFGRTSRFSIFDVNDHEILTEELRCGICPAHEGEGCEVRHAYHNHLHDYDHMISALVDCRVVVCRGMGWRAATALVRRGINPLVVLGDLAPREAAEQYIAGTLRPARGFCRKSSGVVEHASRLLTGSDS